MLLMKANLAYSAISTFRGNKLESNLMRSLHALMICHKAMKSVPMETTIFGAVNIYVSLRMEDLFLPSSIIKIISKPTLSLLHKSQRDIRGVIKKQIFYGQTDRKKGGKGSAHSVPIVSKCESFDPLQKA